MNAQAKWPRVSLLVSRNHDLSQAGPPTLPLAMGLGESTWAIRGRGQKGLRRFCVLSRCRRGINVPEICENPSEKKAQNYRARAVRLCGRSRGE